MVAAILLHNAVLRIVVALVMDIDIGIVVVNHDDLATASQVLDIRLLVHDLVHVGVGAARLERWVLLREDSSVMAISILAGNIIMGLVLTLLYLLWN